MEAKKKNYNGGWIGWDHMDSKSMQPGATPGLSAIENLKAYGINLDGEKMSDTKKNKPAKKRYFRKRVRLFNLINKIKLWPSRTGTLHGIRSIEITGTKSKLTTHCNEEFFTSNSMNCRAGRWLRNKWFVKVCPKCSIPAWKLEKYSSTLFKRHQGSLLTSKKVSQ